MSNRTEKNEIIIGPINDDRLTPGMNRIRSGQTQLFGGTTHAPELTLTPPEKHLYALEVKGIWMWVNGCSHCNKNGEKMSYVVCEEHDRCQGCGTHRSKAVRIPPRNEHDASGGVWGSRDDNGVWGWTCHRCREAENVAVRSAALERIEENGSTTSSITGMKMKRNARGVTQKSVLTRAMTLMMKTTPALSAGTHSR